METIQKSLALFKKHRLIFLGLNLLMIIAGALVISHHLSNVILVDFLSVFSGIIAALDTWLIICLIRLFLNHFALLKNNWLKARISMTTGVIYNAFYVIMSLVSCFALQSVWYLIYAAYHLLFAIAKFYTGQSMQRNKGDSWKFYQYVGYFLMIAAFIFHIMVIFISQHDDNIGVAYPFLVYLIALATFINFISSMIQLFHLRRSSSAYLKASKNISFASSLFSLFFLQTMMLRQFSSPADAYFSWLITIILGTCVFSSLLILGITMIISGRKNNQ